MIFCNQYNLKDGPVRSGACISTLDHERQCELAREYAANLFNWCAACRDYPYAQHAEPSAPFLNLCAWVEIRDRVLREWKRSNA